MTQKHRCSQYLKYRSRSPVARSVHIPHLHLRRRGCLMRTASGAPTVAFRVRPPGSSHIMNIHRVMKMKSLQTNHRPSPSFVISRARAPVPRPATAMLPRVRGRRLRDSPMATRNLRPECADPARGGRGRRIVMSGDAECAFLLPHLSLFFSLTRSTSCPGSVGGWAIATAA